MAATSKPVRKEMKRMEDHKIMKKDPVLKDFKKNATDKKGAKSTRKFGAELRLKAK